MKWTGPFSLSLFVLAASLLGSVAHAKKVNLEWNPIKYAIKYEIQIRKDGDSFLKKTLEKGLK